MISLISSLRGDKTAESQGDSIESTTILIIQKSSGLPRLDFIKSRNDDSPTQSLRGQSPKQSTLYRHYERSEVIHRVANIYKT